MNEKDYNELRGDLPSARHTFGIGWKIFLIIATIVVIGFLGKLVLFPVTVASIATDAATGVVKKTVNADNIITTYEWFFDVNAQYESRKKQIRAHSRLVKDETNPAEKSRLNIELAGMQQSCRDLAAKYNASSDKLNQKWLKSDGLPVSLNLETCDN